MRYFSYTTFAHEIKIISLLAFVSATDVLSAFEELINSNYYVENDGDSH